MELEDDDLFVLIIPDVQDDTQNLMSPIKQESSEVEEIIDIAHKHGTYIDVKTEASLHENQYDDIGCVLNKNKSTEDVNEDYLSDKLEFLIKHEDVESIHSDGEYENNNIIFDSEEYTNSDDFDDEVKKSKRSPNSLIAELKEHYKELRDDETKLVDTVVQIMRDVKPPDPPKDYYIMNGIMLECVLCGALSETIPAAGRHYNAKHGQRYLVCFACGDDFRCTVNLYKHEKRCKAPDANIVLKARANFVGSKGRGRPYLSERKARPISTKKPGRSYEFPCTLCSAVFTSRISLQSHENLHRGLRPHRCDSCPKAYTSVAALTRHAQTHTGIEFICDHCKRSCKSKAALLAHLNTHEPLRKFACSECGRRFAQNAALQIHVRRDHLRLPPPCACALCPRRYPRMSLLKDHMKKKHGLSLMTRKMLFKKLPNMTDFEMAKSQMLFKSIVDSSEMKYDNENFIISDIKQ